MLPLIDPRWKSYRGGRGELYDASAPLSRLSRSGDPHEIFEELWDRLHHQGEVGSAAYAAVPHLVAFVRTPRGLDWNPLAMIAVTELARPQNPQPPPELSEDYFEAIADLPNAILSHGKQKWSEDVTRAAMSCMALAHGQRLLARAYLEFDARAAANWLQTLNGKEE